jgi:hypothetical protein
MLNLLVIINRHAFIFENIQCIEALIQLKLFKK